VREGASHEILDEALLTDLYDTPCEVYRDQRSGQPFYVPCGETPPEPKEQRATTAAFDISQMRAGYGDAVVARDVSVTIPAGAVTVVIGPNASGKSTLMRCCCRLLRPNGGAIRFDGQDVRRGSHKALARRLAFLRQGAEPPAGFTVEDLVTAGRVPHQSLFKQWRAEDEAAVETALTRCDLCELRDRPIETLSGGQQRRCWFGMALAQNTPTLILDEPTTFLDPGAQIALLDIVRALNHDLGRTVVMVLHDLNLAARYADHLVVLKDGEVTATGTPHEVMTPAMLRTVFGVEAEVVPDPRTGAPLCLLYALSERDDEAPTTAGANLLPGAHPAWSGVSMSAD
jgi:iron complex transport system ATP-binding protein